MYLFEVYSSTTYKTATSYITKAEITEINDNEIFVNYIDLATELDADLEKNLMQASSFIDILFTYSGDKLDVEQNLEFPRDFESEYVINNNVKKATAYVAAQLKSGNQNTLFVVNDSEGVKKQKADVLEIEYFGSISKSSIVFKNHPYLEKLLKPYIGSGLFVNVGRA